MQANTHHTDSDTAARKRSSLRIRVTIALSTVAVAATALIASPMAQAIIMRDGGVCDPIRHMGC
jgi:hypothetical protein